MTITSTVTCDACKSSYPHTDTCKWVTLWDKSRFDLCDSCFSRLMVWLVEMPSSSVNPLIPFRGSVTDLATDVAFELSQEQGRELIAELERFLLVEPGKFNR